MNPVLDRNDFLYTMLRTVGREEIPSLVTAKSAVVHHHCIQIVGRKAFFHQCLLADFVDSKRVDQSLTAPIGMSIEIHNCNVFQIG